MKYIRNQPRTHSFSGFTLIELLVTVAIVGIITAIAVPSYSQYIVKTRRADAQAALVNFAGAMERHFTATNSYTAAGIKGKDTGSPAIFPVQTPIDGNNPYYNLTIVSSSASAFVLRATPISSKSQEKNGFLQINQLGAKSWDRSNDGDITDTGENSWESILPAA